MGATPWGVITAYEPDLNELLVKLRHRTFLSEYAQGESLSPEEIDDGIAEVIEDADADGTCSILDIDTMSTKPGEFDHGEAHPLTEAQLMEFFGTLKPNKELVADRRSRLYDVIDRGMAVYVLLYDGDVPSGVAFYGYSYD